MFHCASITGLINVLRILVKHIPLRMVMNNYFKINNISCSIMHSVKCQQKSIVYAGNYNNH